MYETRRNHFSVETCIMPRRPSWPPQHGRPPRRPPAPRKPRTMAAA